MKTAQKAILYLGFDMFVLYDSAAFGYDFSVRGLGQRKRMTLPVETSIVKQRGSSSAGGCNSNASAYRMDLIQAVSVCGMASPEMLGCHVGFLRRSGPTAEYA
jgi:hypothetical protein